MIRAILIDDELAALSALENDLKKHCAGEIQIVEKCNSPIRGMQAIRRLKPDLIFLDIIMPEMTGFEMLEILGDIDTHIIFVSGFDQYAIKAFEISAIDYLLKPVDKDRLKQAVAKVKKASQKISSEHLSALIRNINPQQQDKRIAIPSTNTAINGYDFITTSSIMYCKADGNYTHLYVSTQDKPLLVSKGLGKLEDLLDKHLFFRPHASHIINRDYIQSYVLGDGGYVIMKNEKMLNIASSKKAAFRDWIGGFIDN